MSEREEPLFLDGIKTNPHQSGGDKHSKKRTRDAKSRLNSALDEVQIRFVMNLPPSELASVDRLFFQLEQAWWWYEDFLSDNDDSLPHFSQENFTRKFFQHCPLFRPLHGQFDALQKKFMLWKGKIPVVGCILLNVSRKKVLLVKNWKGNGRTFPRGKINQGESDRDAAVREVQEETGFDPAPLMEYSQKFERIIRGQKHSMFIVPGVPSHFPFNPQVRKEISEIEWFPIDDLPKGTYGVIPFIHLVKKWILEEQRKKKLNSNAVSVTNAQQTKGKNTGTARKVVAVAAPSQPSRNVISGSKKTKKSVKDKGRGPPPPAAAAAGGGIDYNIWQQLAKNIVFSNEHGDSRERDQQMAIDQDRGRINASSSTTNDGDGCYPLIMSLHGIESKISTSPHHSGKVFGKFQFDATDILESFSS